MPSLPQSLPQSLPNQMGGINRVDTKTVAAMPSLPRSPLHKHVGGKSPNSLGVAIHPMNKHGIDRVDSVTVNAMPSLPSSLPTNPSNSLRVDTITVEQMPTLPPNIEDSPLLGVAMPNQPSSIKSFVEVSGKDMLGDTSFWNE